MIKTKVLSGFIESKLKMDASLINELSESDKLKEARLETRIKEIVGDTLSVREKNAFTKCLTRTFMNQVNKVIPDDDFVSLSDYAKSRNDFLIRPSDIKKLLVELDYLVGNYPTGKAYRLDCVFTQFINYQINRRSKRSKEILKLWKKSFLDNIINRNSESLKCFRNNYSFTRPRTKMEGLNCIKTTLSILFMENSNLTINIYERYSIAIAHLITLKSKVTNTRAVNQISYICKHMRYMQTRYGNDYIQIIFKDE